MVGFIKPWFRCRKALLREATEARGAMRSYALLRPSVGGS